MKQVDLSSYNSTIEIGAGKIKQILWYFINVLFFKNGWNPSSGIKITLLKLFGCKVGEGVVIKPGVNIKYPWKLSLGNHVWVGENVWIDNLSMVKIDSHVTLSQGAMILTGSHDPGRTTFDFISEPVVLERGVWIGAKAIVFGGVICYNHSILGLNSVAESNLEAYILYKGNPAIPILKRVIS